MEPHALTRCCVCHAAHLQMCWCAAASTTVTAAPARAWPSTGDGDCWQRLLLRSSPAPPHAACLQDTRPAAAACWCWCCCRLLVLSAADCAPLSCPRATVLSYSLVAGVQLPLLAAACEEVQLLCGTHLALVISHEVTVRDAGDAEEGVRREQAHVNSLCGRCPT